MEAPTKRHAFLDLLFGSPLTGDDLARYLAARPPRWARNTKLSLYFFMVALIVAGWFGLTDRLPLVGPWLVREHNLILIVGLAIIIAMDWYYKRRADTGCKP